MTAEMTNEIAVLNDGEISGDVASEIRALRNGNPAFYSSLSLASFDDALAVVDAVTNSVPVADNLNKVIHVRNVIVQAVSMTNRETGEIGDVPRVVLIDKDGKAYHAMSKGLFISVQSLLNVAGDPRNWPVPVPIVIHREGDGARKYFTARLAKRNEK